MISYVWLIPAIMALAALVNGLGCRKLGKLAGYISVAAMASTFVLSLLVFNEVRGIVVQADHGNMENLFVRGMTQVRGGDGGHVALWTWFEIPQVLGSDRTMNVEFAFHVDQLTSIFLMFISFVGSLVFLYATAYMKEHHGGHEVLDEGYARFFAYLALFAASMYTLILGANLPVLFIGWEGVGLCSYLLIGYYFDRQFSEKLSCADAGKKAFVANRVGDLGLILGMGLFFWGLGTLDMQEIVVKLSEGEVPSGFGYGGALITAATLLLFLGATGKSAQIPLFVWLPDAMAGPTPVSALIHAATMVTAGVYMVARLNVAFMFSPATLLAIAAVGAATAFVAASIGLTQRGIKKILAYSTVSQLGYMFLAMGVGAFAAGIFHVFTHAFFKACLFLAAGSIIHALHHEEDVFKMGGLRAKMPLTWLAYLLATLAIAGIPPLAGFFSKDEILYMVHTASQGMNFPWFYTTLWGMGVVTAAFTAFYMGRSLVLAFHGKTRMEEHPAPHHAHADAHHAHGHDDHGHDAHGHDDHGHDDHAHHHGVAYSEVKESNFTITGVILTLAVCSIFVGFLNVPKGLFDLGGMNEKFHHFLEPITDRGAVVVANQLHAPHSKPAAGEHAHAIHGQANLGALIVGRVVTDGRQLKLDYHGPEIPLALMSAAIGALGIGFAFFLYGSGRLDRAKAMMRIPGAKMFHDISWYGWNWDHFYDLLFVQGGMRLYRAVLWFDKTWVDGFVNGTGRFCRGMSNEFRRLQNGQVQVYGLVMFLGVCLFLLYFSLGLAKFVSADPPVAHPKPVSAMQMPDQTALNAH